MTTTQAHVTSPTRLDSRASRISIRLSYVSCSRGSWAGNWYEFGEIRIRFRFNYEIFGYIWLRLWRRWAGASDLLRGKCLRCTNLICLKELKVFVLGRISFVIRIYLRLSIGECRILMKFWEMFFGVSNYWRKRPVVLVYGSYEWRYDASSNFQKTLALIYTATIFIIFICIEEYLEGKERKLKRRMQTFVVCQKIVIWLK